MGNDLVVWGSDGSSETEDLLVVAQHHTIIVDAKGLMAIEVGRHEGHHLNIFNAAVAENVMDEGATGITGQWKIDLSKNMKSWLEKEACVLDEHTEGRLVSSMYFQREEVYTQSVDVKLLNLIRTLKGTTELTIL